MSYRVYSGPKGSGDVTSFDKAQALYKEFVAFDEALTWARYMHRTGRVALLIEGDDGTHFDRHAIANALHGGMRAQFGGPPLT
jgi:hypothetical protein